MGGDVMPLAIDLYCGLGGWAEGFLSEGYEVVGFDIEARPYPGQLILQDVLSLHGSHFRSAAVIVASPPCQEPSYRAMPWSRAKALNAQGPPVKFIELFEACFRIQQEASEAAGRYIPLIVENVKGAQPWVGRAKWRFGSFFLWGDVPALMPRASHPPKRALDDVRAGVRAARLDGTKVGGLNSSGSDKPGYKAQGFNTTAAQKVKAESGEKHRAVCSVLAAMEGMPVEQVEAIISAAGRERSARNGVKQHDSGAAWFDKALDERRKEATAANNEGSKCDGAWFGKGNDMSPMRKHNSRSNARKQASAMIAKIPFPLAQYIARVFKP